MITPEPRPPRRPGPSAFDTQPPDRRGRRCPQRSENRIEGPQAKQRLARRVMKTCGTVAHMLQPLEMQHAKAVPRGPSVRPVASSLSINWPTWNFAVWTEMPSRRAIALLEAPSAMSQHFQFALCERLAGIDLLLRLTSTHDDDIRPFIRPGKTEFGDTCKRRCDAIAQCQILHSEETTIAPVGVGCSMCCRSRCHRQVSSFKLSSFKHWAVHRLRDQRPASRRRPGESPTFCPTLSGPRARNTAWTFEIGFPFQAAMISPC